MLQAAQVQCIMFCVFMREVFHCGGERNQHKMRSVRRVSLKYSRALQVPRKCAIARAGCE
jgi:hypothetical protein